MIPILNLSDPAGALRVEGLLSQLRLDVAQLSPGGRYAAQADTVRKIIADVAARGDDALVDNARKFDSPTFDLSQMPVTHREMADAAGRIPGDQRDALRRAINQVREYQTHVMPKSPPPLRRPGVELGLRFTPLDSVGVYFPGGKASYPSTLIMLAVPAQVAGVKTIVVATPPSEFGRTDLVLATAFELGLENVFRAGGAAAVAAMGLGTKTIPRVDKIVGPGNLYVQLAKRELTGSVGVDGFLGPSEILTVADDTANAAFIAADLIAQAEHDPGSCFLLTDSAAMAKAVEVEILRQLGDRKRTGALAKSLVEHSAIIVGGSLDSLIELANRFAAEHVNIQTRDPAAVAARVRHAGAIFIGPWSPVAAGDYVAGPSHCLPTNTTARFGSGVSVYEFLKRSSVVQYDRSGLEADAAVIKSLATAEGLDGHAASIDVRIESN
jgi:histidinol dehydrogenase